MSGTISPSPPASTHLCHEADDLLVVFAVVGEGADAVVRGWRRVAHQDAVPPHLHLRVQTAQSNQTTTTTTTTTTRASDFPFLPETEAEFGV